ncbi:MAG TPA: MlaD family protein [Longimicrobiales bacterium]|nr:MlaD family protein [Longimicrobiales bacterium]
MSREGRQIRRTVAGVLIIAALTGAAVLIFFLDAILASFEKRYAIVALMPAAPAVIDGTPVWVGGKEVGAVTGIAFVNSPQDTMANIALTLELPLDVASQVRADSRLRLTSARMIGTPVIDIAPGSPAAPVLGPGDTLRPANAVTAEVIMRRAATVKADLDTLLVDIRRIAPVFAARMTGTRRALADIQVSIAEVGRMSDDLETGAGLATLRDPAFAASLARARSHVAAMPGLIERMQQRSADAAEIGGALTRLQTRADSLSAQLALVALRTENGTLMRLQRDTALIRAMNAARAELDSLMAEARRNPLRFVF